MRTVESIKQFTFSIPFAVVAALIALAALVMACVQDEQLVGEPLDRAAEPGLESGPDLRDPVAVPLTTPVDAPTGMSCNYTTDCPYNAYCNPSDKKCYLAIGTQCNTHAECMSAYGPTAYCHARRCHQGSVSCTPSNPICSSGTYCHVGNCHADMCTSDADCPSGVTCFPPWRICLIP
jgi:hypothetical protein